MVKQDGGSPVPSLVVDTVRVGDAGNPGDPDSSGLGSVGYEFNIGKYEVTTGQYTTFLNTVAATNTSSHILDLWHPDMQYDANSAGISRSGSGTPGNPYLYSVLGSPSRPVAHVTWFNAARFCNWLHNGANASASTENGAYALNGATNGSFDKILEANWWLPSSSEWHKAAYYKGGANGGYWAYPTKSDEAPGNTAGGSTNTANYFAGTYSVTQSPDYQSGQNYLTDAGFFPGSSSAYGLFDQGGNVSEWAGEFWWYGDDEIAVPVYGGSYGDPASAMLNSESAWYNQIFPTERGSDIGFRVARAATIAASSELTPFTPMSKVGQPELPRYAHTLVWTGSQMIVWGGYVDDVVVATGGVYSPSTDSWVATTAVSAPSARGGHTAVWTGDRMIVWGGRDADGNSLSSGQAYFPDANGGSWFPISSSNAPAARAWHTAVWTGTEMIVWGGEASSGVPFADGAAYNPALNSWRPVSAANAPAMRVGHGSVWAGNRMAIWGGALVSAATGNDNFENASELSAVSLANNSDATAQAGEPGYYYSSSASKSLWWKWTAKKSGTVNVSTVGSSFDTLLSVYTGNTVSALSLVGDNDDSGGDGASWLQFSAVAGTTYRIAVDGASGASGFVRLELQAFQEDEPTGTGAFYDPASDNWSAIAPQNAPESGSVGRTRLGIRAAILSWTGTKLAAIPFAGGAVGLYDPVKSSWEKLSTDGDVGRYMGAWTGSTVFMLGSLGSHARGALYSFSKKRWEVVVGGTTGSFNGRQGVWAPELGEFLTFGGSNTSGNPIQPYSGGPEGQRGFRVKLAAPRP